ncbi:FAD-dependent monooxygenase [Actinoallomurus spadix]|uniref:FAD-dependent monooxygenase n=1 Tax=Actinoallomurus spadix TaxID=79912 RepID=A0ABN0XEL7_9ACTN|nr:FAD-dependent monooxygenase [Actinoallomurus spadix]MCO5988855.1 FAD-dependent monooxygenase [Actinoallomurus spadix]
MTSVLIAGGGVGGLTAALALHKAGFEVAVYEAHPVADADIGAFLTLARNGMLALAQLDAARPVAEAGFPLTTLRLTDATGAEIAVRPMGDHGDPLTRYRCLLRAELCAVLREEALRRGIRIRHGKRLVAAAEDATGVTARFGDGGTARRDLLIGADGLNSTLRTLIDPVAAPPRYAGQRVFYGYTAEGPRPERPGTFEMVRGSATAFGYAVSPTGSTFWFARVADDELSTEEIAAGTAARWKAGLLPLLRRDATPAADIVAATGDRLMATNAHDLPAVPRWHTSRMLIIGDAAHAASPATGQGASMAMEDAVVLAKALRDTDTIEAALEAYERLRRPRTNANIAASARMTSARPSPTGSVGGGAASRPPDDDDLPRLLAWISRLPT